MAHRSSSCSSSNSNAPYPMRYIKTGQWLEVLSIGKGHRIFVSASDVSASDVSASERGWINSMNLYGEALVVKRGKVARDTRLDSIRSGDLLQTISVTTMRKAETLASERVAVLQAGRLLEVLEKGEGRRIKVKSETQGEGWISTNSRPGIDLIVKRGMVDTPEHVSDPSDLWAEFMQLHPQLEQNVSLRANFMRCVRPDWTHEEVCCWWLERTEELPAAAAIACAATTDSNTWIGESCPLCLEDMEHGDDIYALPRCQHAFHRACLQPWLAKKADCPLCRTGCDS
mmetsp:Transcript_37844/g.72782  ORF Transcript_37844/g.72782 Transcript_37844/m.72782 type:complete len:286 (+) Transcript_37844:2-859(+)